VMNEIPATFQSRSFTETAQDLQRVKQAILRSSRKS
jgi:hypothetical protein